MLVEDRPGRLAVDAPVVEPFRQADEVAREPVASDVRDLPDPVGRELVAQRLVERPPVARAARIVLAVRADEEERMFDRRACEEVEPAEVLVGLELGPRNGGLARPRGGRERDELGPPSAIGAPHEQEPAVRHRAHLVEQVLLDLVGEAASGERVPGPEPAVLDQEPVVDSAGGRGERLVVLAREIRAEGRTRLRQSASCVTRQMTWPVVTGWPGSTESSETVPARGDVISFSIFIASTTQTT